MRTKGKEVENFISLSGVLWVIVKWKNGIEKTQINLKNAVTH